MESCSSMRSSKSKLPKRSSGGEDWGKEWKTRGKPGENQEKTRENQGETKQTKKHKQTLGFQDRVIFFVRVFVCGVCSENKGKCSLLRFFGFQKQEK